ncbi:nuclear transport factor 2 family protein [Nocardia sp. SYP-A9097]|uniref:nuclear transport factor 2 family protein n=1 Tax=Nocardia sp. SYP-A9097 TaxID=2663237 RepID=UPI00129BE3C4|nr:nuclear transport factor 2 family protein [Nocardia sp. SYP-A9097]MRH90111.1 nuclear transport factor 2 family protein [Nocardia sp. SYP-A9097]
MNMIFENELRHELAMLRAEVRELRDHRDIAALFDTFFFFEDRKSMNDEWAASVFTDDVLLELPPEDYRGIAGLAAHMTEVVALFGPTHHTTTDCHADVHGDHAVVRVNLTATHQHVSDGAVPLIVWGYLEADARRTAAGWRLSRMNFAKVMRTGEAPAGYAFDENLNVITVGD